MSFHYLRKPYTSVERRLITMTVGPTEADFIGADHKIIQAAVEYVAACGGGTVRLLPGVYDMANAVYMKSGVSLVGSGEETVLKRIPSVSALLVQDGEWYAWKIDVADASGFSVGGGLLLSSILENTENSQASVHTIVGVEGNTLYLDSQARLQHWVKWNAKAFSLSSIIRADYAEGFSVEDMVLDGNREQNEHLNGCYGGAVFMQDCQTVAFRHLHVRDFNGDGMSWQVSDDVTVEDCSIHNCATLGLHPGSGSQRPIIRRNSIDSCDTGIYWCWGVKNGLAEDNTVSSCRIGISTGHRDTDNLMRRNRVLETKETAIDFRPERSPEMTSHRTTIEENTIEDASIGIRLARGVENVVIRRNTIRNGQNRMSPGILIEPGVTGLVLDENIFEGVDEQVRELSGTAGA